MASAVSSPRAVEEFTVQGMTGVDLSLPIAGPGSRSYAFLIDWHIRLLLALAWLAVAMPVAAGGLRLPRHVGPLIGWLIVGPPMAIYFLYHPVVELLMRGQTPGKRIAGVRVVNREGGPPGAGAILIRNAFRLIDSLPLFYVVGLLCTFITAQRVRIGDMAAGTLLVVDEAAARDSNEWLAAGSNAAGLDPAALDLVVQLLARWKQLDAARRGEIARALLQRIDPHPPRPPAEMSDAQLRERLQALRGGSR